MKRYIAKKIIVYYSGKVLKCHYRAKVIAGLGEQFDYYYAVGINIEKRDRYLARIRRLQDYLKK